ncbi:unnamed protein product [Sphagnum balticum]
MLSFAFVCLSLFTGVHSASLLVPPGHMQAVWTPPAQEHSNEDAKNMHGNRRQDDNHNNKIQLPQVSDNNRHVLMSPVNVQSDGSRLPNKRADRKIRADRNGVPNNKLQVESREPSEESGEKSYEKSAEKGYERSGEKSYEKSGERGYPEHRESECERCESFESLQKQIDWIKYHIAHLPRVSRIVQVKLLLAAHQN